MSTTSLERPVLAVDVVVLQVLDDDLQVLLLRRQQQPFCGVLALPGVAVCSNETLLAAARRALAKAGLDPVRIQGLFLEQLATFDALYRDPRGRTVSVAHLGLCRSGALVDERLAQWISVRQVDQSLPFDHGQILSTAVVRLQGKIRYTNLAARLLPATFRMEELQRVYEAILGRPLNRANFRSKLLKIGLIERVGILSHAVGSRGGRPPHAYRFASDALSPEERDFL